MFVQYDGLTTECFIDSMDTNLLYFVPKDSVDQKTVNLKEVYYAYNDFDRVFYYSWSFNENLNRKTEEKDSFPDHTVNIPSLSHKTHIQH